MGVDLGGANIGMTKKSLNGADIGAIHEEVGGKGMTKSVGGDVLSDTR